jgi:hypothetical protein
MAAGRLWRICRMFVESGAGRTPAIVALAGQITHLPRFYGKAVGNLKSVLTSRQSLRSWSDQSARSPTVIPHKIIVATSCQGGNLASGRGVSSAIYGMWAMPAGASSCLRRSPWCVPDPVL